MLLLKVTSLLLLLPLVLGLPQTREEVDPRLMRFLLTNDFESGEMSPWYDESPGDVHWVVESLDSPVEPSPTPQPESGKRYLRVTRPVGYNAGLGVLYTPVWTANPGDKVSLSFWIRSRHTQGNALDVYWIRESREEKLLGLSDYSTSTNFDWIYAEAEIPVLVPTNTQLVIYGYCGPNEEDSIAIDNIMVGSENATSTTEISITSTEDPWTTTSSPSCVYELNGSSGSFSSPNYPLDYFNNLRCSWLITLDDLSYDGIRLQFTAFSTEANFDVVRVYAGPSTSSPLLLEHSGSSIPSAVYSYGSRSMLVTFNTDESVLSTGFSAIYEGIRYDYTTEETTTVEATPTGPIDDPYGCNVEFIGLTFKTFTSPLHPYDYPNDLSCRWLITVPSHLQNVELQFSRFATEQNDRVKVYDGPSESYGLLLEHSGSGSPATVRSTSSTILVTFRTDGAGTDTGFSATYYGVTANEGDRVVNDCGGHLSGSGYFASPKYNKDSVDCYWYLESDSGSVQLWMEDFFTEINKNRVIVYNGWDTTDTILAEWSGSCTSCSVRSSSSQMLVRFLSDGYGFKAHFNSASL